MYRRHVIVGCGGIGGWLSQQLTSYLSGHHPDDIIVLVDGDRFERRNIERQLGASRSTDGAYKAEVLAEILTNANPDLMVLPMPAWVVSEDLDVATAGLDDVTKIPANELLEDGDIVYAVVDNFRTRYLLLEAAKKLDNVDVHLGGNDEAYGASNYHYIRREGQDVTADPLIWHEEINPDDDRNPGELSCSERAKLSGGQQTLAANSMAASLVISRLIATDKGDYDNPYDFAEVYIDAMTGETTRAHRQPQQTNVPEEATT